jgi:hypothetical protein
MKWYELFWRDNSHICDLLIYEKPVERIKEFFQQNPGFDLQIYRSAYDLPLHYANAHYLLGHIAILLENGADPLCKSFRTSDSTFVQVALEEIDLHAIPLYFFHKAECLPDEVSFNAIGSTRRKDRWSLVQAIYQSAVSYYRAIDVAVSQEATNNKLEAISSYQQAIQELVKQRAFSQKYGVRNADGTKNVTRRHDVLYEHYSKKMVALQESVLNCFETLLNSSPTDCSYEQCLEAAQKYVEYSLDAHLSREGAKNIQRSISFLTRAMEHMNALDPEKLVEYFEQIGCWYEKLGEEENSTTYLNFAVQSFIQAHDVINFGSMKNRVGQQDNEDWYTDDKINSLLQHYLGNNETVELLDGMLATAGEGQSNILKENLIQFNTNRNQKLENGQRVKNKVIVPINLNNDNWALLCLIYPKNRADPLQIYYFDPRGKALPTDLETTLRDGAIFRAVDITTTPGGVQNDCYNCGPWVVEAARSIAERASVPEANHDIHAARREHRCILISDANSYDSSQNHNFLKKDVSSKRNLIKIKNDAFKKDYIAKMDNTDESDKLQKEICHIYNELKDRAFKASKFDQAKAYDDALIKWSPEYLFFSSSSSNKELSEPGLRHRFFSSSPVDPHSLFTNSEPSATNPYISSSSRDDAARSYPSGGSLASRG